MASRKYASDPGTYTSAYHSPQLGISANPHGSLRPRTIPDIQPLVYITAVPTLARRGRTRLSVIKTGNPSAPFILSTPPPEASNSHSAPIPAFFFPFSPFRLTAALIPLRSSWFSRADSVEMTLVLGMRRSRKAVRAARVSAAGRAPVLDRIVRCREAMKNLYGQWARGVQDRY